MAFPEPWVSTKRLQPYAYRLSIKNKPLSNKKNKKNIFFPACHRGYRPIDITSI